MKFFLSLVAVIVFFSGCEVIPDPVEEFIPGIYARHYIDEFTDSYDTIEIKPIVKRTDHSYVVFMRKKFVKITDGTVSGPFYDVKRWEADYDKNKKVLWIGVVGKTIYFDPHRKELKIGIQPYKKL